MKLVTALYRRLGPHDEELLGDLIEEYHDGRSTWWLWRQVLSAIVIGAVSDVRAHPVVALRAVIVGWLSMQLLLRYVLSPLFTADEYLFTTGLMRWFWLNGYHMPHVLRPGGPLAGPLLIVLSGWLVGRLHRAHGVAMVMTYSATLLGVHAFNLAYVLATRRLDDIGVALQITAYWLAVVHIPTFIAGLLGAGLLTPGVYSLARRGDP